MRVAPSILVAALAMVSAPALTLPAAAQSLPGQSAARAQLFDTRRTQVAITRHPFMTETDIATLQALPEVAQINYYGALAVDPAQGLQGDRARGAFNFHSPEAARAAALSGCGAGCVIVAEIRPRDFADGRPFMLNQDASRAVASRALSRAGGTLAISPTTGAWGMGDGADAAVASCAAAGGNDCRPVVGR